MKRSIFILIGLLWAVPVCFAQNQKFLTKEQEETRKFILAKTDTLKLDRMKEELSITTQREKNDAIRWAKETGNPIRQVYEDGRVIELQRLDKDGRPVYYTTYNIISAQTISTDEVRSGGSAGLNLDGAGIYFGIWDGGKVYTSHTAFREGSYGAIHAFFVDSTGTEDNHATHVAGTILADNDDYSGQGMASKASIDSYDWNHDIPEMAAAARAGLITISNHSYGPLTGWDYADDKWYWYGVDPWSVDDNFSKYSEKARRYDSVAYIAPYFNIVVAAGNNRGEGPAQGQQHYVLNDNNKWVLSTATREIDGGDDGFDCLSPDAVAKNIITVGAVDDIVYGYTSSADVKQVDASFSGWGPVKDGRIKPDIVANGWDVYSTAYINPNNTNQKGSYYDYMNGTSQATPSVSGSIGLLLQYYKQTHNNTLPLSSMVKALIIHTADEAGDNPGPDYKYGWGLMNTKRAAEIIKLDQTKPSVMQEIQLSKATGSKYTTTIFCDGTEPLKLTIAWTDPQVSSSGLTKDLKHDLDIRLTKKTGGALYYPWLLDPVKPADAAAAGDNVKDNVEQIFLASPAKGEYVVEVSHKGALPANQTFSIIITGNKDPETKIFIKQLDNAGNTFEKASYWGDARWIEVNPTDKITFKVEKNYFKAKQEFKTSTTEKYTFWRDDIGNRRYKNWDTLTTIVDMTELSAQFMPAKNAVIQNNLEGTGITSSYTDAIFFKDPWLLDNANATYGIQNQGLSAPLKSYESPLNLATSSSYKGVLQNQGLSNWTPPYYSVKAISPLNMIINNKAATFYFLNWSGSNANIKDPALLETPVQFIGDNALVTANYKGSFLSNNPNALAGNGQRKIVSQGNIIHCAYTSMNGVWYKWSLDYGATWSNEICIDEPYDAYPVKSLSIDAYGNEASVVFSRADAIDCQVYVCELKLGALLSKEGIYASFNSPGVFDPRPVVAALPNKRVIVFKPSPNEALWMLTRAKNANGNWIPSTEQIIPNTNGYCSAPSLAADTYNGWVHLVYQNAPTESSSAIYYRKISFNPTLAFLDYVNVSSGSGYNYNRNPSVTDFHFTPCIAWLGTHYMTLLDNAILKYKSGSTWSGFYSYEAQDDNISSLNVNSVGISTENFVMAWHEDAGGSNQFVKSSSLSNVLESNTNGKYVAVMAGDTYSNTRIMSFNTTALPYYFNFSNTLNNINKAGEAPVSEKILSATNESGSKFYGIGDIEIDGSKIDFPEKRDSINIAAKSALSEPFAAAETSDITYKLSSGILRSPSAASFRDYEANMKFKLDIIDAKSGRELACLNEKSFYSFADTSDMEENYYKVGGLKNEGLVQLRISIANANSEMLHDVVNKYSKKNILQKNFKEKINLDVIAPTVYALSQNFPNPFNPSTIINYDIPEASQVSLKVYDILGREVVTLVDEFKEAGRYNVTFNASKLSTGVYIYQIRANDYVSVKKMSFVK